MPWDKAVADEIDRGRSQYETSSEELHRREAEAELIESPPGYCPKHGSWLCGLPCSEEEDESWRELEMEGITP